MKLVFIVLMASVGSLCAQDTVEAPDFQYIGSNGCKACHSGSKKGAQYKVWAAGPHAKSVETLKSEKAAKIAKERGIKVPAYEASECLICHTTGFGRGGYKVKDEKFWNPADDDREGKKAVRRMKGLQAVGCESCHGPGSEYKSKKPMEEIFAGTLDPKKVGLWEPDEVLCVTCHNENNPTYKPFDFEEQSKEIAHPYPPEMRQ